MLNQMASLSELPIDNIPESTTPTTIESPTKETPQTSSSSFVGLEFVKPVKGHSRENSTNTFRHSAGLQIGKIILVGGISNVLKRKKSIKRSKNIT